MRNDDAEDSDDQPAHHKPVEYFVAFEEAVG
jgi:hypothetical protein